jgi:hypothetical protein
VCFYWLVHCPADISHVENVLNIMALLSPPSKKDSWSKPQTALGLLSLRMSQRRRLGVLC